MTNARNIAYPHRHNADGSFDSICITCFATIAKATDEAALFEQEKNHSCDRSFLAERESFRIRFARSKANRRELTSL
jgi:hypothetical protein